MCSVAASLYIPPNYLSGYFSLSPLERFISGLLFPVGFHVVMWEAAHSLSKQRAMISPFRKCKCSLMLYSTGEGELDCKEQ